ncbi:DUF1223 domain-containing protein, partial [Bradyrhizobium sp.]|uniref:DUF1223 domain-containing protein n=1 Tax=Bradyrhizobium sp. TaxID=376 RepID=UPI00391A0816
MVRSLVSFRHIAHLAVMLAAFAPWAPSAAAVDRPVVIELFTSQGCSSCPPANAYLNEMVRQRRDVLPLAFHVTYWDRLGWKDPFSLAAATDRQARYGSRFVGLLEGDVPADSGNVLVFRNYGFNIFEILFPVKDYIEFLLVVH